MPLCVFISVFFGIVYDGDTIESKNSTDTPFLCEQNLSPEFTKRKHRRPTLLKMRDAEIRDEGGWKSSRLHMNRIRAIYCAQRGYVA